MKSLNQCKTFKEIRVKRAQLSQSKFADLLEMNSQGVSNIERKTTPVPFKYFEKLARIYPDTASSIISAIRKDNEAELSRKAFILRGMK